jgi:hypothetical protein
VPDFDEVRQELNRTRAQVEDLRAQALLAAEEEARAAQRLREAERTAGEDYVAALREQHATLVQERDGLRDKVASGRESLAGLAEAFEAFTSPEEGIARLSDLNPILLFPLRLETRFKPGPAGQPQLWVRVYPDACLADGFEETLTDAEVEAGHAFWRRIWRADGDETSERAAWRELVGTCGSGRAGWVVRNLVPANTGEQPTRADPSDVLLVLSGPDALAAAVGDYWSAVWRAAGDPALLSDALADLTTALGGDTAAVEVVLDRPPDGLEDQPLPPADRATTAVRVASVRLPLAADLPTRRQTWSSAPRVELLPERFVFLGYRAADGPAPRVELGRRVSPVLVAGPDPNADPDDQLAPEPDGTLRIPDDLAWMFDFERALDVGMAFRFDLTASQAVEGFDRVLVLGVRLSQTPDEGRASLERLLEHHLYSRQGMELLRQGTPTNDTTESGSGHTWRDDSERTFQAFYRKEPQFTPQPDPLLRTDGQRLAEGLGLSADLVARVPGAGHRDRSEAHAMQVALWPATVGYLMDTMLAPVFDDDAVELTRTFFTRHVSGRGPLPALRIGNQPYGIHPVTAFRRVTWFDSVKRGEGRLAEAAHAAALHRVVRRVEDDWRPLVSKVSRIGQGHGDPQQVLLDVLGLHPTSAEYYPLAADGRDHKSHELSFLDDDAVAILLGLLPTGPPMALLRDLGYDGTEVPDLLTKLYHPRQRPLGGPVVDDVPLSETDAIRAYASGRNYIQWLHDAATTSLRSVQREEGFDGGEPPAALLYLLLRHAVQLSFKDSGDRLLVEAGLLERTVATRTEPAFVHLKPGVRSESRYAALYQPAEAVTGDSALLLGDYLAMHLHQLQGPLPEHLDALGRLASLPTARLERLFAEHVDTASYRIDAWKSGLLDWALEQLRTIRDGGQDTHARVAPVGPRGDTPGAARGTSGTYLGAFGWVERLRPEGKVLTPVTLAPEVAAQVDIGSTLPLQSDSSNLGLVHAPSMNHATAAAVLRNAHVAHEGRMSVNLSSRRVRAALAVVEGMRGGQSLGALLGYQLERHLHDHGPLQVRALVYPLRRAFPLAADQIAATATSDGAARESIAAMNVVDGRKLIRHVESSGIAVYPFGLATLPRQSAALEQAVTDAVADIRDTNDAVADLALSEGVYQAVLGNYDRAAGTLDAFAKGASPPEPEVVRTPRSGSSLTFRLALHLPVNGPANPLTGIPLTPLAAIEPALNRWLADRLPTPATVGCRVVFTHRGTGDETPVTITQAQLKLHPADLLYRTEPRSDQALTDLDERILAHLHATQPVSHDDPVRILHTTRLPGVVTFFELQGLLRSLRRLVTASRPLRPADLVRSGDARSADQGAVSVDPTALTTARDDLRDIHGPALDALVVTLENPGTTIDEAIEAYVDVVGAVAAYRVPQTGSGFALEWRAASYAALVDRLQALAVDWDGRRARHDELLAELGAMPPSATDDERRQLLRTAEVLVSATVSPETDLTLLAAQVAANATVFDTVRAELENLTTVPRATLADLLDDTEAWLPISSVDARPFDLAAERAEEERFRLQLRAGASAVRAEVTARVTVVDDALAALATTPTDAQAAAVTAAAKAVFGEDLVVVPHLTLPQPAGAELAKAYAHASSGGLLAHLTDPAGPARDFPVDDWLHGLARVRDKAHHWENVLLLSGALPGGEAPELLPVQLPHRDGAPWLAMEVPAPAPDTSAYPPDPLLYTAHWAGAYDPTAPLCGLLLDEWTEVVPGREHTTGVAFHHDRPNAEPPQSWLLALPARFDGRWQWDDLVDAVHDALDSAAMRAIEPSHLEHTAYASLLPATHSAWTFPEVSISNNLLRNVGIYRLMAEEDR